jgi:hypothetical protein
MKRLIRVCCLTALVFAALTPFVFHPSLDRRHAGYHYAFDFLAGAVVVRTISRHHPKSRKNTPPSNAEFLFCLFLESQNCDALVGDLEERFRLIHAKFGIRRASLWYWTQAVRSAGPIVWASVKKLALRPLIGVIAWSVAKDLIRHDSWLVTIVELLRKIRS